MMFPASRSCLWSRRPRPGTPGKVVSNCPDFRRKWGMIFALISCWVSLTAAISAGNPPQSRETLIVDKRVPVLTKDGAWVMMSQEEHRQLLRQRVAKQNHTGNVARAQTMTIAIDVSTATVATTTAEPTSTTVVASSPLPTPFDTALAANFSSESPNCPAFINSMLSGATFKQCYPFSMLLQGSTSFFEAEKSLVTITQVLEASCKANVTSCNDYLSDLADQLIEDSNCGKDYADENSVVVQAHYGLSAYKTLYSATCLKDPDTAAFCFGNAVTNLTTTSNVYLYYLPLNLTLPDIAKPSCNWCNDQTMVIYQSASADRRQAIADTYTNAAGIVNDACGAGYVNATLPEATINAAFLLHHQSPPLILLISFFVMSLSHWLL